MAEVDAAPSDRIAELEMQVATAPDDVSARLGLIDALVDAGRAVEAMVHAETIMSDVPDNPAGYLAAARCADDIGDRRASSYAHVAKALENFVDEAVPDVWSGFVPPGTKPDRPRRTAAAPPNTPAPPPAPAKGPVDAVEHPTLTLRNIIGVEQVKQRIHSTIVQPAVAAEGRAQSAVLMFGPAGCGKSFFARAIAGELKAAFLPVDIGAAGSWGDDPRETVHRIFQAARGAAPCVLFLNDIEHAGVDPSGQQPQVDRALVSRLASELANNVANRRILVLAGSTAPWDVDVALRVAGAIDRTVLVGPPDGEAREAILRYQFQSVPLAGVDISWIVERTQHFSGGDLLALCERAQALAVIDAAGMAPSVGPGHMTRALREVRPSAPAWFGAVMEHAITANQGGMYDDVLAYIDEHRLA